MYVLCSSLASLPEYLTRESHKVVITFESVRNPMVLNLFDSTFKFSTNKVSHHFGNFAERVETRRWASRDSTNQNALFVEWFSRLGRAVFRGVYGKIFALFQACVGNFYPIRPWKVVRTLYLDSSYVTLKYFAFLSVYDKFELLVMYKPPWWFECCFCRSSWIHCWLLLAVLLDFFGHRVTSKFLLCKFRGLPGLPLIAFPLWSVESVLELRDRLNHVAQLPGNRLRKHADAEADVKRETPNLGRVCSILNQKR